MIGVPLEDTISENVAGKVRSRKRVLRGFLVDGAIIPGASGGPVIMKPNFARRTDAGIVVGPGAVPDLLLGIVAEAMHAEIKGARFTGQTFAGLGLAFDAATIRETIELFFQAL
jgi:hypothetical protein